MASWASAPTSSHPCTRPVSRCSGTLAMLRTMPREEQNIRLRGFFGAGGGRLWLGHEGRARPYQAQTSALGAHALAAGRANSAQEKPRRGRARYRAATRKSSSRPGTSSTSCGTRLLVVVKSCASRSGVVSATAMSVIARRQLTTRPTPTPSDSRSDGAQAAREALPGSSMTRSGPTD